MNPAAPRPDAGLGPGTWVAFDFATRSLDLRITTDNSKGASRIFVGADRHYPDGFTVVCGGEFVLHINPLRASGIEVSRCNRHSNPADFIWDSSRQQLIVLTWPQDREELHLKIVPGIQNDPL